MAYEARYANMFFVKGVRIVFHRTSQALLDLLVERGAVWDHSGRPQDPHIHIQGTCIGKFFRYQEVLNDFDLVSRFAHELIKSATDRKLLKRYDRVVGSNDGPGTLAAEVALQLGITVYDREIDLHEKNLRVLQVEDFVRSFRKGAKLKKKIATSNTSVHFGEIAMIFLHSPPESSEPYDELLDGRTIVSAVFWENDVVFDHPSKCPMCKAGSKRVAPEELFSESHA